MHTQGIYLIAPTFPSPSNLTWYLTKKIAANFGETASLGGKKSW